MGFPFWLQHSLQTETEIGTRVCKGNMLQAVDYHICLLVIRQRKTEGIQETSKFDLIIDHMTSFRNSFLVSSFPLPINIHKYVARVHLHQEPNEHACKHDNFGQVTTHQEYLNSFAQVAWLCQNYIYDHSLIDSRIDHSVWHPSYSHTWWT